MEIRDKEEEPSNSGDHGCKYCDISDPNCVVQCKVCQKWFCNGKRSTSNSHIVNHLIKAKHKEVALHRDSSFGQRIVECYKCGGRNVFVLGFIRSKSISEAKLLCRPPCATHSSPKDINLDPEEWEPLINDRTFVSQLVRVPSKKQMKCGRYITVQQINKLEQLWKNESIDSTPYMERYSAIESTFQYLNKLGVQSNEETPEMAQKVLLRYEDGNHYRNIFKPLLKMESDYQKKRDNITVRWHLLYNKQITAYFTIPDPDPDMDQLMRGNELKLSYSGKLTKHWTGVGYVVEVPDKYSQEVCIKLKTSKGVPISCTTNYTVEFVWESTSFDRYDPSILTQSMHLFLTNVIDCIPVL